MILGVTLVGQLEPFTHRDTWTEQLRAPAHVAVAPDDSLLVTDPLNDQIIRFHSSGALLNAWPVADGPIGVAVHPDGRVFVTLRDKPRVAVYDPTFAPLGFLGEGNAQVAFVGPMNIDVATDDGRVYVVDAGGDRVYVFESDGRLVSSFGTRGNEPGQLLYPSAMAVDEPRGRILVADHDNYRVQIYTTEGVYVGQFGSRLTSSGGGAEGWVVRPLGLAVDGNGQIYLGDALMGTVRIFDRLGQELGKIAEFGYEPGNLRTPCGLAVNAAGTRLYVANGNNSSIEVFGQTAASERSTPTPHHPWRQRKAASVGGRTDPAGSTAAVLAWDGPHIVEDRLDVCSPCHGISGQPGRNSGTVEGQSFLCMSCHNVGGRALLLAIREGDVADPFGTNPAAPDDQGRSHAWGVPAESALADSLGPEPGGAMSSYLDPDGMMKCATCHNQHSLVNGPSYVRVDNAHDAMCKECHAPLDRGTGEGGSHPVGIPYPAGEDEYPPVGLLSVHMIKAGMVECLTCHQVHGADSGGANDGRGDGMLLRGANDDANCRACHTRHKSHDAAGDWQPGCLECHDVHDGDNDNVALIAQTVAGSPVSFVDGRDACNGEWDLIHGLCRPPTYDGICETCHTATDFHRNNGLGDHQHHADVRCTICHPHSTGFLTTIDVCTDCHGETPDGFEFPNRAGSHAVHITGANGPHIAECATCHPPEDATTHMDGAVSFASGRDANRDGTVDLAETDVCDECHSADGPFDGVNDPVIGAKVNWLDGVYDGDHLRPGKLNWCLGCHDAVPAVVEGVEAPQVGGDDRTWGYRLGGHGLNDVACTECHDPTLPHTDGLATTFSSRFPLSPGGLPKPPEEQELDRQWYNEGYRLRSIGGSLAMKVPREVGIYEPAGSRLCFECHDEIQLLGVPSNYAAPIPPPSYLRMPAGTARTNYRNESPWGNGWERAPANIHWQHMSFGGTVWNIDHDDFMFDSAVTCVTCHDPHGAPDVDGGTAPALTRTDLNLSYGVYKDHSTNTEYGYIGSGALLEAGGDLHCMPCHGYGAGDDPPFPGINTRYYRTRLDLTGAPTSVRADRRVPLRPLGVVQSDGLSKDEASPPIQ